MRPIKITISAFGPYAGKEVLDMDQLGERGLYLITGDTGAGKSTIFDAIMFCLYGVTSARKRTAGEMRSTYAEPGAETFVELEFEYGGKRYTVRRSPEYMREKLRGEGTVMNPAEADLRDENGLHLTKLTEVNSKLNEIIGLTAEQFSGIAMIAQGEFLKVLQADTKERQAIFRKLFNTDNYETLSFRLKRAASEKKKVIDGYKTEMDTHIRSFEAAQEEELDEKLSEAKDGNVPETEIKDLFDSIIQYDEKQLGLAVTGAEKAQKDYDALNRKEGEARHLKETADKLEEYRRDFDELKKAKDDAEEKLQEETSRDSEREGLREHITLIKNDLESYEKLDREKAGLDDLKMDYDEKKNELVDLEEKLKEVTDALSDAAENIKKYSGVEEKLISLTDEKNKAESKYKTASKYAELLAKQKTLKKAADDAALEYAEVRKREKEANLKASEMYRAMLDDRAGFLAEEVLKEGEKCPVCGSVEHPDIAKRSKEAPSEEDVDKAREELNRLQNLMIEKSDASKEAGAELKAAGERTEECLDAMPELAEAGDDVEAVYKKAFDDACDDLKQAEADKEESDRIKKETEELLKEKEKLVPLMTEKKQELGVLEGKLHASEEAYDEAKKKLEFESKSDAEAAVKSIEGELEASEKALEEAKKKTQDIKESMDRLSGQISEGEAQTKDFDQEKYDRLEEELDELSDKLEEAQDKKSQLEGRIKSNGREMKAYLECREKWDKESQEYVLIKDLADTASGELSGKSKLMLETFVQTSYLDRILRHANMRLRKMSEMRYELVRKKSGFGRSKQSGLDLNVIDHHNGTERSVNTLSGGESFMASLSLALGLSEEIRESAGGIRLDTMFVDEGFGTLSEDALSSAIKALMELSEEDRLVGIISHVDELRQRIDKKIVVTHDRTNGSHASVEV